MGFPMTRDHDLDVLHSEAKILDTCFDNRYGFLVAGVEQDMPGQRRDQVHAFVRVADVIDVADDLERRKYLHDRRVLRTRGNVEEQQSHQRKQDRTPADHVRSPRRVVSIGTKLVFGRPVTRRSDASPGTAQIAPGTGRIIASDEHACQTMSAPTRSTNCYPIPVGAEAVAAKAYRTAWVNDMVRPSDNAA